MPQSDDHTPAGEPSSEKGASEPIAYEVKAYSQAGDAGQLIALGCTRTADEADAITERACRLDWLRDHHDIQIEPVCLFVNEVILVDSGS
jgi:hypothetical protein